MQTQPQPQPLKLTFLSISFIILANTSKHNKIKPQSQSQSQSQSLINLTNSNFNELVYNQPTSKWLILFYTDWCPYCKQVDQNINNLASNISYSNDFHSIYDQFYRHLNLTIKIQNHDLLRQLKLAKVECDSNRNLCYRFDVNKYPEIRLVDQNRLIKMINKPTIHNLIQFAISKHDIRYCEFIPEQSNIYRMLFLFLGKRLVLLLVLLFTLLWLSIFFDIMTTYDIQNIRLQQKYK